MKTSIYGVEFTAPDQYAEGHTITAVEAIELNKIVAENVANNFRPKMKKHRETIKEAGRDVTDGIAEHLSDEDKKTLQDEFAQKASEYKFGISARRTAAVKDPVEREARKLAMDHVKAEFKASGYGIKDNMAIIKEQGNEVYEQATAHWTKKAKALIKSREKSAEELQGLAINVNVEGAVAPTSASDDDSPAQSAE